DYMNKSYQPERVSSLPDDNMEIGGQTPKNADPILIDSPTHNRARNELGKNKNQIIVIGQKGKNSEGQKSKMANTTHNTKMTNNRSSATFSTGGKFFQNKLA